MRRAAPSVSTLGAIARAARSTRSAGAGRASVRVLHGLARKILAGDLAPGTALPSESELTLAFGVSRMSVRQALYQLEELGLVRVHQGRPTEVLDPEDAVDPRVLALTVELAVHGDRDTRDLAERVILHVGDALELAEGRIRDDELDELDAILDGWERRGRRDDEFVELEGAFYTAVARATRNGVFHRETRWWFRFLRDRSLDLEPFKTPPAVRFALCRELAAALRDRTGAAELYRQRARMAIELLLPPIDD